MVVDNNGQLISSIMPEVYGIESLSKFSEKLVGIIESINALGIKQNETVFNFEGIKVVIKTQEHGHLVIMSLSNVSLPLLNLSTNIVCKKISNTLEQAFASPMTNKVHNVADVMKKNMTITMSKLSSQAQNPPVKESKKVSKFTINTIEGELANIIGPAAKIVIKKTIQKLGGNAYDLPASEYSNFLQIIGKKIGDNNTRHQFNTKIKNLTI